MEHEYTCGIDDKNELPTPEVAVPDLLDMKASELPTAFEGFWIARLVRSFAGARKMGGDMTLDLFQIACQAAAEAIAEAEAKGGETKAFVKRAVRHSLTDTIRRRDTRLRHIELAEDGPRDAESDPRERLIESIPDIHYPPSRNRVVDAVRIAALLVSPPVQLYWQAFKQTDGSNRAVARLLRIGRFYVRTVLAPRARREFAEALKLVDALRGGAL